MLVFDKSFEATNETTFVLDIEYTTLNIKESTDGKINIKYVMGFNGYRKKQIENRIKHYKLEANKKDNKIRFTSTNVNSINLFKYDWDSFYNTYINKAGDSLDANNKIMQKSKDSLLFEINESDFQRHMRLSGLNKKIENDKKKKTKIKGKFVASEMTIEIPPYVNLRAKFNNSEIIFKNELRNPSNINSKNSKLRFRELTNPANRFYVDGGKIKTIKITNGYYKFSNVKTIKIGEISEASLESEFSKIEIGEVVKKLNIKDFNSEYFIYNWGKEFDNATIFSSYSKWHFFLPKNGYRLTLRGKNNKVFEVTDLTKQIDLFNYDPNWLYTDSSLYGTIGEDFSNSIIYNYKQF